MVREREWGKLAAISAKAVSFIPKRLITSSASSFIPNGTRASRDFSSKMLEDGPMADKEALFDPLLIAASSTVPPSWRLISLNTRYNGTR